MLRNIQEILGDVIGVKYSIISLLMCKITKNTKEIKDFISFINLY